MRTLDDLSPIEKRFYESGDWVAAHEPRCGLCGCLLDNHRTGFDISDDFKLVTLFGSCGVCFCPGEEEK